MEVLNTLVKPEYQLNPWQVESVKYHLTHHYSINASMMGVGKTLSALATAYFHQRRGHFPVLCIVPASLSRNWESEIYNTSATYKKVQRILKNKEEIDFTSDFVIISYDYLRANHQKLLRFRMVICDEAHALKNIQAKQTIAAHTLLEEQQPDVALFLTGTPIKNRVPELYSLLCLCSYNKRKTSGMDVLEEYSFYEFQDRFCYLTKKKFGKRTFKEYYGLKNKELLKVLLRDKYIRIKSDVLGFDEPIIKHIEVDYSNEDKLQKAWEEHNKGSKKDITAKAQAAMAVAPFTLEYCHGLMDSDCGPLVIFSDHVASTNHITQNFKGKIACIHGSTSIADRDSAIAQFTSGKLDAIALTIGTSSTGLNLQNANHMIFNDLPWVPEDLSQAMARTRRNGQKKQCYYHFIAGGRVGKYINENILKQKQKTLKEFHNE